MSPYEAMSTLEKAQFNERMAQTLQQNAEGSLRDAILWNKTCVEHISRFLQEANKLRAQHDEEMRASIAAAADTAVPSATQERKNG